MSLRMAAMEAELKIKTDELAEMQAHVTALEIRGKDVNHLPEKELRTRLAAYMHDNQWLQKRVRELENEMWVSRGSISGRVRKAVTRLNF